MRYIALPDFLTPAEIDQMAAWYAETKGGSAFIALALTIIEPNMERINTALGQENDARFLAYAVEYVMTQDQR